MLQKLDSCSGGINVLPQRLCRKAPEKNIFCKMKVRVDADSFESSRLEWCVVQVVIVCERGERGGTLSIFL